MSIEERNRQIIPYADLMNEARQLGLRCVYPNGGAFSPIERPWAVAGWLTGDDATLRPDFADRVTRVDPADLGRLVGEATATLTDGVAWLAPVHHWAAELDHGHDDAGNSTAGLFPSTLRGRTTADAIELTTPKDVEQMVSSLMPRLWKTDFTLLFPGTRVMALLHHHRQVWWRCEEVATANGLLRSAQPK